MALNTEERCMVSVASKVSLPTVTKWDLGSNVHKANRAAIERAVAKLDRLFAAVEREMGIENPSES